MSWREIPLTRGLAAVVDEVDYDGLAQFKWRAGTDRRTTYMRSIA